MLKSIIRFLTPVCVLAATLGAGYLVLGMFQNADNAHQQMMDAPPATLQQSTTAAATAPGNSPYPWVLSYDPSASIASRIPVPRGYERVGDLDPEGFANWLRNLPLKVPGSPVRLFSGQEKPNQLGHVAVIDIDTGILDAGGKPQCKDIQQSADAIIRLRAEYLYGRQKYARVRFGYANATTIELTKWAIGVKPTVDGNQTTWSKPRRNPVKDYSYTSFRQFLETVFNYETPQTLAQELTPVSPVKLMGIGNVFVQAGNPGHAAIVVDMIENKRNGAKAFLLAQAGTPAQDIHIIRNTRPADTGIWPWFDVNFGPQLVTPDFKFNRSDLKRFK